MGQFVSLEGETRAGSLEPRCVEGYRAPTRDAKAAAEDYVDHVHVREENGLNNLAGVDETILDTILHPDTLAYMREVRHKGLAARYNGPRQRVRAKPHPNARRNLDQVFKQIWKDVLKAGPCGPSEPSGFVKGGFESIQRCG